MFYSLFGAPAQGMAKKKRHREQQHGHCLVGGSQHCRDNQQQGCYAERYLKYGGVQQS